MVVYAVTRNQQESGEKEPKGRNERKKKLKKLSFLQSHNLAICSQMGKASPCYTPAVQATPVMVHISAQGC